jgi:hypothetical protein
MTRETRERARLEAMEAQLRDAYRAMERTPPPPDLLDIVAQLEAQTGDLAPKAGACPGGEPVPACA